MKKIVLPLLIMTITLFAFESNAQKKGGKSKGLSEGTILLDGYYGYGNLYNAIFKAIVSNNSESTFSSIGPLGIRGEYLLSDKIGLGIDIGFNSSKIQYKESDFDADMNLVKYDASLLTSKLGTMLTFNYHFINNSKFDSYFVFGLGYGSRTFTAKSDYVGYVSPTTKSTFPVASKLGFGFRYFFTDNIGMNLALGVGQGGLVNAGITAKF